MTDKLSDYERRVLTAFAAGSVDRLRQGAALNAAAEFLVESGYMGREGNLLDKGYAALGTTSPMRAKIQSSETKTHVDGERKFCDFPNCDCSSGAAERCSHPPIPAPQDRLVGNCHE